VKSDKELLDAIEAQGCGVALVHDDDQHWYVVTDGIQNAFTDGPQAFQTSYWIDDEMVPLARKTAREAIQAWIEYESREDSDA